MNFAVNSLVLLQIPRIYTVRFFLFCSSLDLVVLEEQHRKWERMNVTFRDLYLSPFAWLRDIFLQLIS